MLNPNSDRLDYGQILAPPAGYELDFAVGTTYSLDFGALVGASLAMGLSEETDSELARNEVFLLETLRNTGDKVALFCESGQIHLPSTVTPLYILLEKVVFPVKTARRRGISAYPSFHPKFWMIRYRNHRQEKRYRVIVLSRNLTFDRSWDVSCYLDGHTVNEETDKNEPVCDFLRFLIRQLPSGENGRKKARAIRELIRELPNVQFELDGKEFYDYQFIPNGIKKEDGSYYCFDETPLFRDTFHEIMIISPFVSGGIIRHFNDRNNRSPIENSRYMLITRAMSLNRLKQEDISHFRIFTMKDQIIDGEEAISEGNDPVQRQDIHAKVYLIRKYSNTDLYLGSLNASHNAVYGNVEFMLRLRAYNRYLNMDRLTGSLFGNDPNSADNPFQETDLRFATPDAEGEKVNQLEAVIKEITRGKIHAEAFAEGSETFGIKIQINVNIPKDYHAAVRPLLSNKIAELSEEIHFSDLSITQLSEFYAFSVSDGDKTIERVMILPTEGLPEEREKAVVSSIIANRDCFYRYIAFLLGDNSILSMLEAGNNRTGWNPFFSRQKEHLPSIYERMLQAAATAPEKFKGIEYLMKTISEDGIIPEEFRLLYDTFKKAVKLNG